MYHQEFGASFHSVVFAVKKACIYNAEIYDVRSFKCYKKDQFYSEVADIPWSVVESFVDVNDAVSASNTLSMLLIIMYLLRS